MKKYISSLIIILFIFCDINAFHVHALNSSKMEAMLVVDVSKSMQTSDPHLISNEAMKMFVDMASIKGDKIGVIAYADEVMRESALVKIRSEQDKNNLKSFIDSLAKYPHTDISVGVKEALKLLDMGHEETYFPLIVLLADGNNDLSKAKGKTSKEADDELTEAVAAAKEKGYPIYTIGLNADGKLNKEVLQHVAEGTNGKFFETTTADDLPGIISEIFASHLKLKIVPVEQLTSNGDFQDIHIYVPNQNVIEANISLISDQPVEIKLLDPSGNEQTIPSNQLLLSKSKSYSMLKLVNPEEGAWTLKVKGVPEDKIDINLIFNYDLQLKLKSLPNERYKTGDTVKITSFFEDNGMQISYEDLYKSMKATILVKDLDTGKTVEYLMKTADDGFTGEFQIGKASNYEVAVKAEADSFFRETESHQLSVEKSSKPEAVKVQPETTTGEKKAVWPYIAAGALILLAAITILLIAIRPKRGFTGQIVVEIKNEDTGERSNPQYKKLKTFKGKLRLHQLLALAPEFSETEQIIFKPHAYDTLLMTNASDCTIEKSGRAIDARKGLQIKRNDRLRIVLKKVNKSIYIEYIS
ncbi:MAG: vWA domain-containing protein [Neobacillus sp.]